MAPPSSVEAAPIPAEELASFAEYIQKSHRILALCGAGLSASSGLPTFRGAGGYWRENDAISLATPQAFAANPGLVWQFYNYRRHMALKAQPNRAHLALAELARKKTEFLTISQNVDGLSPRAHHPPENLELLHGSLYDIKCPEFSCNYFDRNNFTDPIAPALAIDDSQDDISNAQVPLRHIPADELPLCPKCNTGILRPGVVWFGESLPVHSLERIDRYLRDSRGVDLIIVIGTSASVFPAAGYIDMARQRGARVAVVNTEPPSEGASKLHKGDWFFHGDAGVVVPQILESVTGPISQPTENL